MARAIKPILLLAASAMALAACTSPGGTTGPKTQNGVAIGGLLGAFLGASRSEGNSGQNTVVGAIAGATVGGLIGQELDRQETALRASIGNNAVSIVNTGSKLVVTLPEDITFDTGSAVVRPALRTDIQALASNLGDFPDTTVVIIGNTDNIGAAEFNQRLSARRANSVFEILAQGGVAIDRMRAYGRGEDDPKASNLTAEGRAQNRRVEIIIRPAG